MQTTMGVIIKLTGVEQIKKTKIHHIDLKLLITNILLYGEMRHPLTVTEKRRMNYLKEKLLLLWPLPGTGLSDRV